MIISPIEVFVLVKLPVGIKISSLFNGDHWLFLLPQVVAWKQ
jgi:hypothetical protein